MTAVGIRALKTQLSRYLKRVQGGERLVVTAHGKPVAVLSPPPATDTDRRIEAMLREGVARWGGGKPTGSRRPPRVKGPSVARAVIEGRR
jgi:prevent-host-death family protein